MNGERDLAASPRRLQSLAEKFHDKQYRDAYVGAHNRGVLAQQMHNFRGALSQADYAAKIGKQKTVIGRLENPAYGGWSLRTMLEIARKENVAVLVRFVDLPTFLNTVTISRTLHFILSLTMAAKRMNMLKRSHRCGALPRISK